MSDITVWKLIIDIALVISLGYLCYRFSRSSTSTADLEKAVGLKSTLEGLLRQAESASHSFGDDLAQRQRSLEQLLFDIETVEQRLNKSMNSADELKRNLQRVNRQVDQPQQEMQVLQDSRPELEERIEARAPVQEEIPEPPSFQTAKPAQDPKPAMAYTENTLAQTLNIYGEAIESGSVANTQAMAEVQDPLVAHIEREVQSPAPIKNSLATSMEDIYASAEEMLKAGKNFEAVSADTQIPLEEVKMLSQIISQEEAAAQAPPKDEQRNDPRLGVLGGIKRQNIVL